MLVIEPLGYLCMVVDGALSRMKQWLHLAPILLFLAVGSAPRNPQRRLSSEA